MKKIGLSLLGLVVIVGIYYVTTGSKYLVTKLKSQVHKELSILTQEGFSIHNRDIKEKNEHFVLSFDEPEKIAQYFSRQGIQLNVNNAKLLKGLKIGVGVGYMVNTYTSLTFDIYPLALPDIFAPKHTDDKKALAQIQDLFQKKTFLMHLSINILGFGFKGHMKDIDEVLGTQKDIVLNMKALTFSGDMKKNRLQDIKQNLGTLRIQVPNELAITLSNLQSYYEASAETAYDYRLDYAIEKLSIASKSEVSLLFDEVNINSISTFQDELVSGSIKAQVKAINFRQKGKSFTLHTMLFDMLVNNFDIKTFEKLQQISVNDETQVNTLAQEIISKGVHFSIPTFSVDTLEAKGKKMDGFEINAHIDIDKALDITAMRTNPLSALAFIDANLKLNLSEELFTVLSQQPQVMLALMLFQPKDLHGKKSYVLDLKDGKLSVNAKLVM